MKRRDFITLLGGTAVAWPLAARAQQPKRVGILATVQESDPSGQGWLSAFQRRLAEFGWIEDQTVRFNRLCFPKITSGHIDGAARQGSGGRRWFRCVE
jgi:putative ABC transport system substrate-binding protein